MRTTIDSAGRLVVPKAIRDAMGLSAGRDVEIVFTDGRIEIEIAPARVHLERHGKVIVVVADEDLPELTDQVVRDTLESARR